MRSGATQSQAGATLIEEQHDYDLQQQFVDGLYAHVLQSRTRQVCEAATGTYEWIFPDSGNANSNEMDIGAENLSDDPSVNRQEQQLCAKCGLTTGSDTGLDCWLRYGSSLYWITGKPGSGKSTLIKFIAQHRKTEAALREWAGSEKVTIVSFYFWISGAALQRSVIGLLQSIFHQILDRNRELIAILFPYEWRRNKRSESIDWTEETFIHAIDCLAELEHDGRHRFCFFIDGLDEYRGIHSTDWLCGLLLKLGGLSHIKLYVSSRYWPVFQSAFLSCPILKLHEWTRFDVEEFVHQKLETHPLWIELTAVEAGQTTRLVRDISWEAEGVFLWVVLTVKALVKDLVKGVTIEHLYKKLQHLLKSLNEFFNRILKDLDFDDRDYVIKALLLTNQFSGYFGLLIIILSQLDTADPAKNGRARVYRRSVAELEASAARTERRLISLCSDLLQIRNIEDGWFRDLAVFEKVAVLSHRTLADYVENTVAAQPLRLSDGTVFDTRTWFNEAFVVVCQTLPACVEGSGLMELVDDLLEIWSEQFRSLEPQTAVPDQRYLAKLDSALLMLFKTAVFGPRASEIEISISDLTRTKDAKSRFPGWDGYLYAEHRGYTLYFDQWLRGVSLTDIVKDMVSFYSEEESTSQH